MSSPIINILGPNFDTGLGIGQDFLFVPDVSALRGANSIEALITVGLSLKTLIQVVIDGEIQFWQLQQGDADGTDPENSVQPLDYDATTNNVNWHCVGKFKSGLQGIQMTTAASQSIPSGVDTAISFDTERMNTGEWNAENPTRFTCVTPGVYAITGAVSFASNASGQRKLFIKKSGGSYVGAAILPANSGGSTVVSVATLVYLLTGDYLELVANQTSGGSLDAQKLADYSPEFGVIWLGNPIAQAIPASFSNDNSGGTTNPPPPSVTSQLNITDAGWYRIVESTVPEAGGFSFRRVNQSDGSILDCDIQYGVFGAPDTGVIQVIKNVMTSTIQGVDMIRVSYEGDAAYVDVHITLPGLYEITHAIKDSFVEAPFVVDKAGADGVKSFTVIPNVIGSTEPVEVPELRSNNIKIASPATDGWVMPTGTVSRTSFDPTTVTLPELAKRVAALILDENDFGSIHEGLPTSMIYTDMLSLDNSFVAEGTSVNISDIFRITVAPDTSVQGIYVPVGTANGHTLYRLQGYEWNTALTRCVRFNGGTSWEIYGPSGILYTSTAPASPAEPWLVTQWQDQTPANVTVTTIAPNIAQIFNVLTDTHTAVYLSFSPDISWSGVYLYTDTFNGLRRYYQLGGSNNKRVEYDGFQWVLKSDLTTKDFTSDAPTYPDQAHWGFSALQQIDAVDYASGVVISGGGSNIDGIYVPQLGVFSGSNQVFRRLDGTRFINGDEVGGTRWYITDIAGGFGTLYASSSTFAKFPWQASWTDFSLIAQEKNVAGPTNWHV